MVPLDCARGEGPGVSSRRDLFVRRSTGAYHLRSLVLPKDEAPSHYYMKAKFLITVTVLLASPMGQALACSVCYGARDGKTTEHMAVAIWVLMGVVMSVMGGVGAFSFHLWRHAHTPLEPHQELTDEDLDQYD
jgi:hypothetical protein